MEMKFQRGSLKGYIRYVSVWDKNIAGKSSIFEVRETWVWILALLTLNKPHVDIYAE